LLPRALAELADRFPAARVDIRHDSSAAQFQALQAGDLDVALVREHPVDPNYDAVLAAEEALGVILAARNGKELAGSDGIRLDRLAALGWIGFARSEAPSWHDQITATLRCNGVVPHDGAAGEHPLIGEVKLAAVAAGDVFALAPPDWASPGLAATVDGARLPGGIAWYPLAGNPLVRRTWAAWHASSRRRDLAALVAALDVTARTPDRGQAS
jgi:DNA-binding transcriptional LysR family regulator